MHLLIGGLIEARTTMVPSSAEYRKPVYITKRTLRRGEGTTDIKKLENSNNLENLDGKPVSPRRVLERTQRFRHKEDEMWRYKKMKTHTQTDFKFD